MKKSFIRHSIAALVVGVGALASAPAALAQSSAPVVCPGYEPGKTTLVGERTGKKVQKAYEAYGQDLVDDALTILYEIDPSDDFDKAYVQRFIGNLLAAKEGEGKKALGYLKESVEPKVLNDLEHTQTLKLLGDLSMQEQAYLDAIKYYNQWMDYTCKEDADVYTRITQAYYESKQLDKMIEPADKAIALYKEPNKNPYVLKLTSYYERKMFKETVDVAETLVSVFPDNAQWWSQLGFFYMLVEDFSSALSTFEIAYNAGFLSKESHYKTLYQLYANQGMPYKAATTYKTFMDNGTFEKDAKGYATLANAYHQAKNYELAANNFSKAASMSQDPEYYRKAGVLYLVNEDYKDAIKSLTAALDRGVEDTGKVHFSLMEANFYAGNFKKAFEYAELSKKDKALRRNAQAWIPYIEEKAKNRNIKLK